MVGRWPSLSARNGIEVAPPLSLPLLERQGGSTIPFHAAKTSTLSASALLALHYFQLLPPTEVARLCGRAR